MWTLASFWTTRFFGVFYVWQIPIIILLIVLIIFWRIYRSKQM